MDMQRGKRHARWHLPDVLRGSNTYLADRIDGLITDTTSSPFTTVILPYKYIENVDQKLKWNAWSFDEGLASRVPYESAARTLTQTKRSYAGGFSLHCYWYAFMLLVMDWLNCESHFLQATRSATVSPSPWSTTS